MNATTKEWIKYLKVIQVRYVASIPRKRLPPGIVLVHNHVIPQRHLGENGFRAWTQQHTDRLEVCRCKWAGLKHYRVKRTIEEAGR
jgi:hypothetical protein